MKIYKLLAILVVISSVLQIGVFAVMSNLELKSETEGLYRYELANGKGFLTTVSQDEIKNICALFEFDADIAWHIKRDGQEFVWENKTMLTENGKYNLTVVSESHSGEFDFEIDRGDGFGTLNGNLWAGLARLMDTKVVDFRSSFDANCKMFKYEFPSGSSFLSSAPNGAIVHDKFRILFSKEEFVTLSYDGNVVPYINGSTLRDEGVYNFCILHSSESGRDQESGYVSYFSVRILRSPSNLLDVIWAPQDFSITKVLKYGDNVDIMGSNFERLSSDGEYEFEFSANFDDKVKYVEKVYRKTEQPIVVFSKFGLGGYSQKPVYYKLWDPRCHLQVFKNGAQVDASGAVCGVGNYLFKVWDEAGNVRVYSLLLDCKPDFCVSYFIMILFVPLILFAWFWLRRDARVRVV